MGFLESLGNIGSFVQGAVALVALVAALGAWKDWERKRARDRRADVATRVIRRVAVTCEEMSAAICAPVMRIHWAKIASHERGTPAPIAPEMLRTTFEERMSRTHEQLRELFMLHVEARVHLVEPGEIEALSQFMTACTRAEEGARCALIAAENDLALSETRQRLAGELTRINDRGIDAREHAVRVLGPVARDGRPATPRPRRA